MQRRRLYSYKRWLVFGAIALACGCVLLLTRKASSSSGIRPKELLSRGKGELGFQFRYSESCDELLNSGGWVGEPLLSCEERAKVVATCGKTHENSWQWSSAAIRCGASRLSTVEALGLLRGKWVAVVGDSVGRTIYAALLRLLAPDKDLEVIVGHRDFEYSLPGDVRASFFWAPYAQNITALFEKWTTIQKKPDGLILSIGLWHMLHVTSAQMFAADLKDLKAAAGALTKNEPAGKPPTSMCTLTEVYPAKLRAEKQPRMTLQHVDAYNRALSESGLLLPRGGMFLLDVHQLTQGCGGGCTDDGIHYSNATYDAAVQIWGNSLRVLPSLRG